MFAIVTSMFENEGSELMSELEVIGHKQLLSVVLIAV